MSIRYESRRIFLNINDLVKSHAGGRFLSSFPLHKRGMLGQKAHRRLQRRSSQSYNLFQSEYHIHRIFDYQEYEINLQGRIDSLYRFEDRIEVEEIKSVLLTPGEFKDLDIRDYPGFIEQLLFYAFFLQEEFKEIKIKTFLLLINLINDKERVIPVPYDYKATGDMLDERFHDIIEQKEALDRRIQFRRSVIRNLDLSLTEERPQQRTMMEHVGECLVTSTHMMVSAPTGTGKTIAALFPAVQFAWLNNKKVYFGTSKTTQQHLAAETLRILIERGMGINSVVLRSAEKMCANDTFFCHETYCPYARNYRKRFDESDLSEHLYNRHLLLPDDIYELALDRQLCPFEVSLDLAMRADVLIGDYNYIFDPAVQLNRFFAGNNYSDWILILDEAHNLLQRGMDWLSPSLDRPDVRELMWSFEGEKRKFGKDLFRSLKEIDEALERFQEEGELLHAHERFFTIQIPVDTWERLFIQFENAYIRYLIHKIRHQLIIPEDPVETFYFNFRHLIQVARIQERPFVPFFDAANGGRLKIRCCDPSGYLQERLDRFSTVIAMSATLEPMDYYQKLLGFNPERTMNLTLDSPFEQSRRKCVIVPGISTRYQDRRKSYPEIAEIIKSVISIRQGNYLVFFPSFDYLQSVYIFLGNVAHTVLIQRPQMTEEQRDQYLDSLRRHDESHLLLGVTGGIFAEGVDYPGDMAIGVIVISPSLPAVGYERELLHEYFEEICGRGMEYAYIYPGMNRVIQAVGRLIRTSEDRGIVVLVGERFAEEEFQSLLPVYWFRRSGDIEITDRYERSVREFWERKDQ